MNTPQPGDLVPRHKFATRAWHWVNVIAVFTLLMTGLGIFNAHPRLYWGEYGANQDPAFLEIGATAQTGYLRIGDTTFDTTGFLGRWEDSNGTTRTYAFPGWMTLPASYHLAMSRNWHLAFAWVLAIAGSLYLLWTLFSGHLRRDLAPDKGELRPSHLWHDIKEHARLRFPTGIAALRYNILQKLAYLGVLLVLLPGVVLTGLTMSPGMNAAWPWLLDLFGGRQSARSLHFICALLIAGFILVHLLMVILAGPWNEVRSMVTGRFRLPGTPPPPVKPTPEAEAA